MLYPLPRADVTEYQEQGWLEATGMYGLLVPEAQIKVRAGPHSLGVSAVLHDNIREEDPSLPLPPLPGSSRCSLAGGSTTLISVSTFTRPPPLCACVFTQCPPLCVCSRFSASLKDTSNIGLGPS